MLRKLNGTNAIAAQSDAQMHELREFLAENARMSAKLQNRLQQFDVKLGQIAADQAVTKAKLDRVIKDLRRNTKSNQDVRTQLAVQEIKSNGFWFVDIPRTSSTSIRVALGKRFGPVYAKMNVSEEGFGHNQYVGDHLTASQMSDVLGANAFEKLLTFTVVRNPWARAYSFYSFRLRGKTIPQDWTFTDYCRSLTNTEMQSPHFNPAFRRSKMVDHICDADGKVLVSHVIRFEGRHEQLAEIAKSIGCPSIGALHVQGTAAPDQDYKTQYTPETEKLIGDFFAQDVAAFGYSF